MVKNRKRKRRLNPVYWVLQYFSCIVAISSFFLDSVFDRKIVRRLKS